MSSFAEPLGGGFTTYRPLGKRPDEIDWTKKAPAAKPPPAPLLAKACPTCGLVMQPKGGAYQWARKVYCSKACIKHTPTPKFSPKSSTTWTKEKAPPKERPFIPATKVCAVCKETFQRAKHGMSKATWEARRCCSKVCAARSRVPKQDTRENKPCAQCGADFRSPIRDKRKFCCVPCQHKWSRGRPRGRKAS
jgi:hypothetical protein